VFPPLKVNGTEQPPTQVAQVINDYFLNIPGNLNIQAVKNNDFISQLKKTLSICISTHANCTCYRRGNSFIHSFIFILL